MAALLLDGADGWAARRQRLASAFGARFDMEVDALAILVLAVTVVKAQAVPYWVLAIGVMRYLYLAAALVLPLLRRPLPPRPIADRRRKTVAVIQSLALLIALAPATWLAGRRPPAPRRSGCSPTHLPPISSFCCSLARMGEVE